MSPGRTRVVFALTAVGGITVDQLSKALVVAKVTDRQHIRIVGNLLVIIVTRNGGAAFSFAPAATVVFAVLAVAISVVIIRSARRLRSVVWALAFGLILAGAVGNLIDRIVRRPGFGRGAVIDFIDLKYFAIFNIADACISGGAVLAVLLVLYGVPLTAPVDSKTGDPDTGKQETSGPRTEPEEMVDEAS